MFILPKAACIIRYILFLYLTYIITWGSSYSRGIAIKIAML